MTEQAQEEYDYYTVDPRLRRALDKGGPKGYANMMLELAGTQKLDEHTKKGLFWQMIGWLASEAGRAAARPWQLLSFILMATLFVVIAWVWNLMFLMALGLI